MGATRGRKASLPSSAISVTLNSSRWDDSDAELMRLHEMGVLAWTPLGKDDDLFTIQTASDQEAWIVTNDRFEQHRRHTSQVRSRLIGFYFAHDVFSPNPDEAGAFLRACGRSGGT